MQDEENPKKNGPLTTLLMLVVGVFALLVFLGFFVLWAREGWDTATTKNPIGSVMFFTVLGLGYLLAIPYLWDKGHKDSARLMLGAAAIVVAVFLFGGLSNCGESGNYQTDRPYRK